MTKIREIKRTGLNPEDKILQEAIHRVYRKYGTNLQAFYRDVYEELTSGKREACESAIKKG